MHYKMHHDIITAPGRGLLDRRTTRVPQLKVKLEEKNPKKKIRRKKSLSDVKAKGALHS
jgi:hypothetical protein